MSFRRRFLTWAMPVSLLALSACATPFTANVARFQQMPAPQGQSFVVQSTDPRLQGGLEFQQYAGLVTQHLVGLGYTAAPGAREATFVVQLDYNVDRGQQKVVSRPGYGGFGYGGLGYGGFGYGRFGSPFYPRFGYRSAFLYGWNDPFLYGGGFGQQVDSYTLYTSSLNMQISRTTDGTRLFEGRARAHSSTDDLTKLVPSLVEAMFTGFPGRSGEDVRITIKPEDKRVAG